MQPNELTQGAAVHQAQHHRDARRVRPRQDPDEDRSTTTPTSSRSRSTQPAKPTLDNARLYDPLPAQDAFKATQEITPFYSFTDVDVDRYKIGDESSQADPRVGARARPRAPARQLVDEPAPRVHARLRRRSPRPPTRSTSTSRATCSRTSRRRASSSCAAAHAARRVLRRGPRRLRGRRHARSPSKRRRATGTTTTTQYSGTAGVKVSSLAAQGRARAPLRRLEPAASRARSRTTRASSTSATSSNGCRPIAPFLQVRLRSVPGVVDGRSSGCSTRYTTTNDYPYSQSIHPQEPAGQRARHRLQLRAQLGEGDGRRVRRHGALLRGRPDRSDHPDVPQGVPRAVHRTSARCRPTCARTCATREDIFSAQTEQYALYHITDPVQYFNKQAIWDVAPSPDTSRRGTGRVDGREAATTAGATRRCAASGSPIDPLYLTMALPPTREAVAQEFVLERSFTPRLKGEASLVVHVRANPTAPTTASSCCIRSRSRRRRLAGQAATLIQSDQFISSQFTLLGSLGSKVHPGQRAADPDRQRDHVRAGLDPR